MASPKLLHSHSFASTNPDGLPSVQPNEFLPPVARWITFSSLAMLAMFGGTIALTAVLNYSSTVKAPAVIRPTGELRVIQSPMTGRITRIDVKLYQMVRQGQPIAYLEDSRLQTQKQQLQTGIQQTQQQLNQVNAQIQAVQSQIAAETQTNQRNVAMAEGELRLSQQQHQEQQIATQAEVREAEASVKLAQEELDRYQSLSNTGAVSQSQIGEKAATLEIALARLQRLQAALNPSRATIDIAMEKVAQERTRGTAVLAVLHKEQMALAQQQSGLQDELDRDRQELQQVEVDLHQTVIRAPSTGIIQQLNLRNVEQLVQQGDLIAQIAPDRVPFVIKAHVSPQDIGQIKTGQSITMKISSCPYPDYGTLNGEITTISPDLAAQPSSTTDLATQNSLEYSSKNYYEVTIQTPVQALSSNNHTCPLQAGMDGTVDIVTRQETVLVFLMRKMKLLVDL